MNRRSQQTKKSWSDDTSRMNLIQYRNNKCPHHVWLHIVFRPGRHTTSSQCASTRCPHKLSSAKTHTLTSIYNLACSNMRTMIRLLSCGFRATKYLGSHRCQHLPLGMLITASQRWQMMVTRLAPDVRGLCFKKVLASNVTVRRRNNHNAVDTDIKILVHNIRT